LAQLKKYKHEHGGCSLLEDYAKLEMEKEERIVFQNATFLVVCPWWATWPFEVMILSKKHKRALVDLIDEEKMDFAEAIAEVTRRYDNLFETSFPYSKYSSMEMNNLPSTNIARFGNPPGATRGN
jgi:UDPglucose--hexose-1-phosphate uridylyltransferase